MAQITLNSSGVASSGSLLLQTNGTTTQATVDTSGNLGLGVTPSAWGTANSVKALQTPAGVLWNYTSGNLYLGQNYYFNGSNRIYLNNTAASEYQQNAGAHYWYTAPSGTAGNAITFTQAMTLDASGNLGVNVTSPQARLDVRGTSTTAFGARNGVLIYNTNSSGNQSNSIGLGSAGSSTAACFINTDNAADGTGVYTLTLGATTSSGVINFLTNGSERARIDSSGNLLVGTTTTYAKLVATQSSATSRVGTLENTAASGYSSEMLLLYYSGGTPNTASANFIRATDATNDKFIVATTGNVTNRNNSYGGISDVKLKENITDATPKLAQLNQVRVVNYNFIGSEEKQLGVVAQEIEAIFPALVTETPDVDNDGNDLGTTTKSVKYSVFVPMLIKALQEQQAIITQLQADVTALKG